MTNPFEDNDGTYLVLVNAENQHSLWPAFADIPAGWTVAHDKDTRDGCLAYVEQHWTDLRPASLVRETEASAR
ncbi:MbtH family protein [Actinokineospora iranica]|uniref:MbtH protein n=1 Tax=Actinokineospora iranica TaxID=1271860 RepID=A0A1G6T8L1_9PSEU|nr:MbtH family protein [Actinokineospora iranica]SDD25333.1 MbtH protein [Actinokineospora iranica]